MRALDWILGLIGLRVAARGGGYEPPNLGASEMAFPYRGSHGRFRQIRVQGGGRLVRAEGPRPGGGRMVIYWRSSGAAGAPSWRVILTDAARKVVFDEALAFGSMPSQVQAEVVLLLGAAAESERGLRSGRGGGAPGRHEGRSTTGASVRAASGAAPVRGEAYGSRGVTGRPRLRLVRGIGGGA